MKSGSADAKAIFLEALDCKEADELMRYLEQACGSNIALKYRLARAWTSCYGLIGRQVLFWAGGKKPAAR
jgi:hypothetical protein